MPRPLSVVRDGQTVRASTAPAAARNPAQINWAGCDVSAPGPVAGLVRATATRIAGRTTVNGATAATRTQKPLVSVTRPARTEVAKGLAAGRNTVGSRVCHARTLREPGKGAVATPRR